MTLIPPATDVARLDLPRPYLLFLGDVTEAGYAKTAFGLRDWAREQCVGELSFANAISVGLPQLTPAEARACGARAMVIGVANVGGPNPGQLGAIAARSAGGRARHRQRHARAARDHAGARGGGGTLSPPPHRCAHAAAGYSDREWAQAQRQALAGGRNRLRARQEVHRSRDCAGVRAARRRHGFSRHRSDRDHDRRHAACPWMRS